jgi:hypothetical protein
MHGEELERVERFKGNAEMVGLLISVITEGVPKGSPATASSTRFTSAS